MEWEYPEIIKVIRPWLSIETTMVTWGRISTNRAYRSQSSTKCSGCKYKLSIAKTTFSTLALLVVEAPKGSQGPSLEMLGVRGEQRKSIMDFTWFYPQNHGFRFEQWSLLGCLFQKCPSDCVAQTCLACKLSASEDEENHLKNLFQSLEATDVWHAKLIADGCVHKKLVTGLLGQLDFGSVRILFPRSMFEKIL